MRTVNVHVAPRGNAFMRDIATWIVEAAGLLGRNARLRDDGGLPDDSDATNLVVAPHEFYLLGDFTNRQIDHAVRISVPVCTEQPGTQWFEVSRIFSESSPSVLDINRHGVDALRELGLDAHHLQLGGVPSMDRRTENQVRDVELLFMGGRTQRRCEVLAELAPLLWDRNVDLRLFSFSRPVTDGVAGLVFGRDKYDLLARSRILLNIHRDDTAPGYFEWARMVEAMANGVCVVTEPSAGFEPLRSGVDFIESEDLADTVGRLLDDPQTTTTGDSAATAVLDDYPLTRTLGPELDRIDVLPVPTRRRVAPRYLGRSQRDQRPPLLPAFRPNTEMRRRLYRALTAETMLQRRIERARCLLRHGVEDHVERIASASYAQANPEVSVVVTLYDYAHLVTETLDSIAASIGVEFEIIVVDDHSTDGGRDVVRRWVEAHPTTPTMMIGSDINRGLPVARNLGFDAARAAAIMVIDADNLVYPTALRRLKAALDTDREAAFAYAALEEFGTCTGMRSAMAWHVPWLCERNYIDAQAMLRREVWERYGGYRTDDPLVFGWEDWELWLRLAAAGERGVHVAQMLGRYRIQAESMLTTTNLVADRMLDHLRELYPDLPWPDVS